MSDGVAILLFCLALAAPVVLVVGLATLFSRKSRRPGRSRGTVSVSDTMNDINNAL